MISLYDRYAHVREVTLRASEVSSVAAVELQERFPQLVGFDACAAEVFASRKVVIVGLGSVGRRIGMHVTRLGVKELWLTDPGKYDDRANLLTHEILASDLDDVKVVSVGRACKKIHSGVRVLAYEGNIQDLDPVTMADADVVFLASDNLAAEVDVSSRFRALGVPIIQASVHGETLVAQVRFVANRVSDGPCLICGFGSEEFRHLNRSSKFPCSGNPATRSRDEQITVTPTMSTSFLCSLAADFAVTQWTRHTLTLGAAVADTFLQYCGYTHHVTQADLVRNRNCRGPHTVLERVQVPNGLAECTFEDLLGIAGFEVAQHDGRSITLGSLCFVRSAICHCAEHRVGLFSNSGEPIGTCVRCREKILPQPYYTFRPTPESELEHDRQRPLKELGAKAIPWAVLHDQDRGVLLTGERS